jgi:5-methylcytosine-specific restriction endonuclease McrA
MTEALRGALRARRYRENNYEKYRTQDNLSSRLRYKKSPEKKRKRAKIWRAANPDKVREMDAIWVRNNPNKRRIIAGVWAENNPEKVLESARLYRETHREECNERVSMWGKAHPEKRRAYSHARRARLTGVGGSYTVEQFEALGDVCLCCGRGVIELAEFGLMLVPDHVIPIAKGGSNDISNIQPLCHGRDGCNNHKGTKNIDYRKVNHGKVS